ncbi:RNA-directed DNA polymerase from mobile element jockey-like protein [Anopheles sinensis]|uniref:RNA-directed DNA polymerase from mobile element jockey-like protein n=1 Tax=Anopheles sinensis TaxID=74873 RepID=A0A084VH79_ANOSI|nr:RNA-directed DNA polymerase from mobile element jockey-like protein [Anopheles sinensis]
MESVEVMEGLDRSGYQPCRTNYIRSSSTLRQPLRNRWKDAKPDSYASERFTGGGPSALYTHHNRAKGLGSFQKPAARASFARRQFSPD